MNQKHLLVLCFTLPLFVSCDDSSPEPKTQKKFNAKGYYGLEVKPDNRIAVRLHQNGCNDGDHEECYQLGRKYYYGIGVTEDKELAVQLLEKSCEGGVDAGCFGLGRAHQFGWGSKEIDYAKANALFLAACERGEGGGCNQLAANYEDGKGFSENRDLAVKHYQKACDLGSEYALTCP